jgi:hypothetical protein
MSPRSTQDSVALLLAGTVAVFVLGTLIVVFALALMGTGLPDVWTSLFGLVIAVLSAVGGYLGGKEIEARKRDGQDGPL